MGGAKANLDRGWRRARLIRALAVGEKSQVQLADEFGVTQSSISSFLKRHAGEVATLQEKLNDEWAALWVADKYNRVAELQSDIEDVTEQAAKVGIKAFDTERLLRIKHTALRQIAEELGQLKVSVELGGKVTYVIEGINPDVLS